MANNKRKLSDMLPARTAGALPSSRTQSLLEEALASDNIDDVKAQLVHVWAHYQSLEFMLVGWEANKKTVEAALEDPDVEVDVDPAEIPYRFFATGAIDIAYDNAHSVGFFMGLLGMPVTEALRNIYDHLDFNDPEREAAEALKALDFEPEATGTEG